MLNVWEIFFRKYFLIKDFKQRCFMCTVSLLPYFVENRCRKWHLKTHKSLGYICKITFKNNNCNVQPTKIIFANL